MCVCVCVCVRAYTKIFILKTFPSFNQHGACNEYHHNKRFI